MRSQTRRYRALVAVSALAGLTACGGAGDHGGVRTDQDYANAMDVGREAFDMTRAEQARTQFQTAYDRALLRDDAVAIDDAGYNLGVAQLGMGDPQAALGTVAQTHRALTLRGATAGAELELVAMAAYCRLGQYQAALDAGGRIQTSDPALSERRAFLTGLAADGLGDVKTLASARDALPHSAKPPLLEQADRAEIESRLALRQRAYDKAENEALKAVTLRRDILDYRGMARGLDCAANAARGAGQLNKAASYAQRAAESRAQAEKKP
ncbi:hypothetical protein [Asaia spathodeae]|uniref:Uncharacterized protein n=1 Tax=Asaia spathodeae TaxID=657016 RepID=A0ABX2P687_9PROT|nr:hypothetical protein [Asaia spathodeae]GBR22678.1 hypothetical protein AA105894_3117 [Asaia spathodeae NBRC 105894]